MIINFILYLFGVLIGLDSNMRIKLKELLDL